MKHWWLVVILYFKALAATSQSLMPNPSIFEIYDYQFEYYSKVRNKLFWNLSDKPEVRLLIKHSFSPEYIFQIERNDDNTYTAIVNSAAKNIWYDKDFDSIEVLTYSAFINSEDVNILRDIFLTVIRNAHYPIRLENLAGTDGVTYNFSAWDYGLESGSIWSPDDHIHSTLIKVCDALIQDIRSKKKKVSLSESNKISLEKVLAEIRQPNDSSTYILITKIKQSIEKNKKAYCLKLQENHRDYLENLLLKFEKKLLIELTFAKVNSTYVAEILTQFQKNFEGYIMEDLYGKDDKQDYIARIKSDSIFLKLKSELN